MVYRYLPKFLIYFNGISHYFSEIITDVALGMKICKCLYSNLTKKYWKMSVVVTGFSNDESARSPTLLKTVSTIDLLIDQVHKF